MREFGRRAATARSWRTPLFPPTARRGSFLLIALGILFCVALYSVAYFNYMLMQRRLSERAGRQGVLSKVANALAVLAVHKMQFGPLLARNSGGAFPESAADSPTLAPLYQELSRPRSEMQPAQGQVDLEETPTSDLYSVSRALIEPLEHLGTFGFEIAWRCDPADFEEIGLSPNGYRREKRGMVRLKVTTRFRKGDRPPLVEEFDYQARVKVTAALVPVLSKFTLYVENLGHTDPVEFHGLNQVTVDENGEVYPTSPARPLVLDNDGEAGAPHGPLPVPTAFQELVEDPRGLVYLGGSGTIVLNLAQSPPVVPTSGSGECFQLFRRSTGDGFYKVIATQTFDGQPLDIFQMDVGMSSSPHPSVKLFYDLIREYAPAMWPAFRDHLRAECSSIFRLFGVDANRSPTLALGNLRAMSLLARTYSYPPLAGPPWSLQPPGRIREKLFLYDDEDRFLMESQVANGKLVPLVRAGLLTPIRGEVARYLLLYSSFVASRPYNLGIAFAHNQRVPDPWTGVSESDTLYKYFQRDIPDAALHGVPSPFARAAPAGATMKEMASFLGSLDDPGRISYRIRIPTPADPDLPTALQRRGLLWKDTLTLSGWIAISSADRRLVLDRSWKMVGNGGIILEEGDLILRGSLVPLPLTRERVILQLVARKGNIRLETPPDARIQASLVADGRVIFAGHPSLRLTGNVAMRRLFESPDELARFPGGSLAYYPPLAAIPAGPGNIPAEARSEKPVLCFSFELSPRVLE